MKKVTLSNVSEFLHFRAVCEQFRIQFNYWVNKGGTYIVEADAIKLETIGY